jgi:hypothetical protein
MSDCTCDKDTLINDPGMSAPRCPVHDLKPQAVRSYVKGHGGTIGGVTISTNHADDPFDADKIRKHMEGDDA